MALAADTIVPVMEGIFADIPVKASTTIYEGSLVHVDSTGYAVPLSGAGQKFVGVADRKADNASGASAAIKVRVQIDQHVREIAVTGTDITSNGLPVYASDDCTLTITGASGNQLVGKVLAWQTGTTCQVLLKPYGNVGLRMADIGAAPSQSDFNGLLGILRAGGIINV